MPMNSTIISLQIQRGIPTLWVIVDMAESNMSPRHFLSFGTGYTISETREPLNYIGTYQLPESGLVFHVFEDLAN